MKDIICAFALPSVLVVDCCDCTFSMTRACFRLPQHRQIVGCDLNWEFVASIHLQLALIIARQVLNERSNIIWDDDVQQAAFTFVKALEELKLNRRINACKTRDGFPIM